MNRHGHFDGFARLLHWSMAAMIVTMLFLGVGMVASLSLRPQLIDLHRPLGIALLVLVLVRLYHRWRSPPPLLPADLPPLRSFILPGGGPLGAYAHLARTVCRRAERTVVALTRVEPVRAEAVRYLNRLSDYFFVVARAVAHAFAVPEVLWDTHRRSSTP